jgi:hypothetical protein
MITERKRSSGKVRHIRIVGFFLMAVLASSGIAAGSAFAKKPPLSEDFGVYAECPTEGSAPNGAATSLCVVALTETGKNAGHYRVGNITVPLSKRVELQYGLAIYEENEEFREVYVPAANGETLPPTKELAPGEPIAHITVAEQEEFGWPQALKESYSQAQAEGRVSKVYETIELAGIPVTSRANLLAQEGSAVVAPLKIKGENKWLTSLGDRCYIGSNEEPIVQHLTSGESRSPLTGEIVKGEIGEIEFAFEFDEVLIKHNKLVDNTYAVPGASCKGPYAKYINAAIDKVFGIPAAAGASVTELKGTLFNADTEFVEEKLGY